MVSRGLEAKFLNGGKARDQPKAKPRQSGHCMYWTNGLFQDSTAKASRVLVPEGGELDKVTVFRGAVTWIKCGGTQLRRTILNVWKRQVVSARKTAPVVWSLHVLDGRTIPGQYSEGPQSSRASVR